MNGASPGLLRSISISILVAILTTLSILVVAYLTAPIAGIQVEGALMFPESEAWNAVPEHASLLTFNPAMVEKKVESNPWVKGAEVSINWESGIVTVEVQERRPVLDGYVDGRQVVLAADGTELPELGGVSLERVELDRDQLEDIVQAARVLESNGVTLESVDAVGAGGIEATVSGRRVIFSGGIGVDQARALDGIMEREPQASHFDLRSSDRVVVGRSPDGGAGGGSEG